MNIHLEDIIILYINWIGQKIGALLLSMVLYHSTINIYISLPAYF